MYDLSWCFPGHYNGLIPTQYITPNLQHQSIHFQIHKTNTIIINNDYIIDLYA
jgi:hypothetical protein